jgi:hypothetical protein
MVLQLAKTDAQPDGCSVHGLHQWSQTFATDFPDFLPAPFRPLTAVSYMHTPAETQPQVLWKVRPCVQLILVRSFNTGHARPLL